MPLAKRNIVWLASYPKSGNTWFRVFLSNLLSDSDEPININRLNSITISSNRILFDKYLGVNSSDLTSDEIEILRPEVYRLISQESEDNKFFKVHDAWKLNKKGEQLFPNEVTKGIIYFIRNPLDIVVSYAFHNNISFDKTIRSMNNIDHGLCLNTEKLFNQVPQYLYNWSKHVSSWVHNTEINVHIIKYEDMAFDTYNTFIGALKFLNLEFSKKKIFNALENSSFTNLKSQERASGFHEKNIHSKWFFRNGIVNNWASYLNQSQVNKVIKQHKNIMNEFGYL